MAKAKSGKSVGLKVRPVGADGFYSDEPGYKNAFKPKKKKKKGLTTKQKWAKMLGVGNKQGEGALAKRRKSKLDKDIKQAGG